MTWQLSSPVIPLQLEASLVGSAAAKEETEDDTITVNSSPKMSQTMEEDIVWPSPANTGSPSLPLAKRPRKQKIADSMPVDVYYERAATAFHQIFDVTKLRFDDESSKHLRGMLQVMENAGADFQDALDVLFQTHDLQSVVDLSSRFGFEPDRATVWAYLVRYGFIVAKAGP